MDTSLFLARLLGPVLVVLAIGLLTRQDAWRAMAREFTGSAPLLFLSGFMTLLGGLALVNTHNVWEAGWPVIITIFGWLAVIGGIARMLFPETVVGIKDSSGVWSNTEAMLDAKWDDFCIFPGSEEFLLAAMRKGGAGCISATANVNPAAIHALYATWQAADAEAQQAKLNAIRGSFAGYVMIPGLKAVTAHYAGDDGWRAVRPPLVALSAAEQKALVAKLEAHGFAMRGLTAKAAE